MDARSASVCVLLLLLLLGNPTSSQEQEAPKNVEDCRMLSIWDMICIKPLCKHTCGYEATKWQRAYVKRHWCKGARCHCELCLH